MTGTLGTGRDEESTPALLEQPWARVKTPTAIPDPLDPAGLLLLPAADFARLLRDQLVPRQPSGAERERWEQLWGLLSGDDQLADRAYDVLEGFLDQTEQALSDGQLDDNQQRRARKFAGFCEAGWQRLQRNVDEPLGWAGRAAHGFNPLSRRVIAQLIDAITQHRQATLDAGDPRGRDEDLWRTLGAVGLDPDRVTSSGKWRTSDGAMYRR